MPRPEIRMGPQLETIRLPLGRRNDVMREHRPSSQLLLLLTSRYLDPKSMQKNSNLGYS